MVFTFQSGDTIVIDTDSELSSFLTDIGSGALDLTNQSITINSAFPITVSQANTIDSSTTGTITASIATDSTVDSLVTLTGNNAYTIVINASDATGNTANDLNTIDAATSVQVDASQITDISGNYSDIIDLYTSSLPEILPPVGVTGLGNEATITDELSVSQANILDDLTTGVIATIGNTKVSDLLGSATLSDANENNDYIISISAEDAAVSISDLNNITSLTSKPVNISNVTEITSSSILDFQTFGQLLTDNEFINPSNTVVTVAELSDETIDATALAETIDVLTSLSGPDATTLLTLANGATINIDASEIAHMLDDESNSRLNISNQDIIVSGSNTISVDTANDLSEITKGIVTANIFTSRVSDLKTLNETNNSYTINLTSGCECNSR